MLCSLPFVLLFSSLFSYCTSYLPLQPVIFPMSASSVTTCLWFLSVSNPTFLFPPYLALPYTLFLPATCLASCFLQPLFSSHLFLPLTLLLSGSLSATFRPLTQPLCTRWSIPFASFRCFSASSSLPSSCFSLHVYFIVPLCFCHLQTHTHTPTSLSLSAFAHFQHFSFILSPPSFVFLYIYFFCHLYIYFSSFPFSSVPFPFFPASDIL